MRVVRIVFGEVGGYSLVGFKRGFVVIPIDFVLFQTPPKPFGEHIVDPPSFPVHTDSDFVTFKDSGEFFTRELGTLVRIEYLRFSIEKHRFFEAFGTEPSIQSSREPPREHLPRIPVDDGDEVDEASFEPDVGDIRSPDLVLPVDFESSEEIWVFLVLTVRDARIPLRAQRPDAERLHRPPDHPPSGPYSVVPGKDLPDPALSEVGRFGIYPVDEMENVERNRTFSGSLRIRGLPAHPEKLGLPDHSDGIFPDKARFPSAPIQGARQIFF